MSKNKFYLQDKDTLIGKTQEKITNLTGSSTFCALPWIHFATRPNGDMRLCCSANASGAGNDHTIGLVKENTGKPTNFSKDLPLDAWNNDYMKSVRTTMLKDLIPSSCTKCFEEESKGVVSKRLWETEDWRQQGIDLEDLIENTQADGTVPDKLFYLDLRLGHTCNLKCIMCSPHDSSRWVQDHKKVFPLFKDNIIKKQMNWDSSAFDNKWHENPEFWNQLYDQIPNLKQIYFAGGEPLMIKEHKLFLEEIIRRGYAGKILIRYNTNGALLDDDIINLWEKFRKVKVGLSLDDIEERNFYIRFPADWNTIEKNLERLDNTPDNIHVSIATAIQILNIKTLPDLAKWKIQKNYRKINLTNVTNGIQAGGGIVNMHLLYIPTFLSIQALTKQDKEEVRDRFAELKSWLWENYRKDDDFWKVNPYGWKRWEAVLDFMDSQDKSNLLPSFREYITQLEQVRGTNFKQVFPHLSHLI